MGHCKGFRRRYTHRRFLLFPYSKLLVAFFTLSLQEFHMNPLLVVALGFQTVAASLAVIFNTGLLYIMKKHTSKNFGFYKYILMSFAFFEIIFAIAVLLGEPIFFISQRTLIAFTYYGPLAGTSLAILGPTTYCFFYLVWLGFVVVHFLYRYVTVCQRDLKQRISGCKVAQAYLWALWVVYLVYSFFCAYFSCKSNQPHQSLKQTLYEHFGIDNQTELANYVLRFTDIHGNFSLGSTIAVLTHYFVICGSILVVILSSWKIWKAIRDVRKTMMNISLERQLFKSLILQTCIPIIFSHLPSLFAMFFPLMAFDVDIFSFFSVFTTVPKALDPIILLMCIKCYRRGLAKIVYDTAKLFVSQTTPMPASGSRSSKSKEVEKK